MKQPSKLILPPLLVIEAIGAERKSKFTGRIPKITVEVKP